MIKYVALAVLALTAAGCNNERIETLERRQSYIFDLLRGRRLPLEMCEAYSDGWMSCTHDAKGQCACTFKPDQLDMDNAAREIAIQRYQAEMKAQAEAEKGAQSKEE